MEGVRGKGREGGRILSAQRTCVNDTTLITQNRQHAANTWVVVSLFPRGRPPLLPRIAMTKHFCGTLTNPTFRGTLRHQKFRETLRHPTFNNKLINLWHGATKVRLERKVCSTMTSKKRSQDGCASIAPLTVFQIVVGVVEWNACHGGLARMEHPDANSEC